MASQVFSGNSSFSYTNNTGQNVRIILNYVRSDGSTMSMSWTGSANVSSSAVRAIGRNLAFSNGSTTNTTLSSNNAVAIDGSTSEATEFSFPTEIMISNGQTFSITSINCYNIVVIPEAG